MPQTLTEKLIRSHLLTGNPAPGTEIGLRVDQTLTQDATGTLVMLGLEAMGLDRVRTEISAQYVDHNLLQQDFKNADDHLFLRSACQRFGVWYSRPGNGVSHPLHMQRFGAPGKTLLGSDSHTCAGGALGMLAIGTGGLEVAMAMCGEPFHLTVPRVFGVELSGKLLPGVSAKDVVLEMLRRHGVRGARGHVIEYFGSGLTDLSVWDRHVIANMGAELGATTSVFPADSEVRRFLEDESRVHDFQGLEAEAGARYDRNDSIDLSRLEPLIARPSSPGNVVGVREVVGEPIYQTYIGSSANPGFRDVAIAARMVRGRQVADGVSFDINPSTSELLLELANSGLLADLVAAGARIHQPGCNGCIGMGQAPASGRNSLRTVPRNFPGRSGTREDRVWLCSPETAAASALAGEITDPRDLARGLESEAMRAPKPQRVRHGQHLRQVSTGLVAPLERDEAIRVALVKGPNIRSLPELEPIPNDARLPVLLKLGDDISTDEILPAGTRVLPFRSNIDEIANFCFEAIDSSYVRNARKRGNHAVVAGENFGQGSSREHAALAPRHLGLLLVIAKSFSRIYRQNLINFGALPLTLDNPDDYDKLHQGGVIVLENLRAQLDSDGPLRIKFDDIELDACARLSKREKSVLLSGGLLALHARSEGTQ